MLVGEAVTHDTESKRVLIVDDETAVALTLAASLEKLGNGYVVETANNGEEAMTKILQISYALLITDYKMPGMSGLELARTVRCISPNTQVVLMSAYGTDELCEEVECLGIGYLDKPFTVAQIREIVERAVGCEALAPPAGLKSACWRTRPLSQKRDR